jgi:ankyrin repeat protein
LTATSCHPETAGVQLELMELLINHGAIIDGPDAGSGVNACLHNGRGQAAEYLANHGARLDLEGAAGVGRVDVVKSCFNDDGTLKPPSTEKQLMDGFAWACEFGRNAVIDFLLQNAVKVEARLSSGGETGLHWAAYEGQADTVGLLLERGAPIDVVEHTHGGTPLGWAVYGWGSSPLGERTERTQYYDTVRLLARAGATMDAQWYQDDEDRQRAAERARADPRMQAALRGEAF